MKETRLKLGFVLILLLYTSITSFATHFLNGTIYYNYKGKNSNGLNIYEVTVVQYRDCNASGVKFDSQIEIGLYTSDYKLKDVFKLNVVPDINGKPDTLVEPYLPFPVGLSPCVKQAIFQSKIEIKDTNSTFILAWKRCCRTGTKNIPTDEGNTLYTYIPGNMYNSTPNPLNSYPFYAPVNKTVMLPLTHFDEDGDSISYRLITALNGANETVTVWQPESILSITNAAYVNGFSGEKPFGKAPASAKLDSVSGRLIFTVPAIGSYVVAYEVEEWRNSQLIAKHYREQLVVIVSGSTPKNSISLTAQGSVQNRNRIYVYWNHNIDTSASNFILERRTNTNSTWTVVGVFTKAADHVIDTAVIPDVLYWYRVTANTVIGAKVSNISKTYVIQGNFSLGNTRFIQNNSVKIYPNPTSDKIFIAGDNIEYLQMFDVRGRKVYMQNTANNSEEITISDLPAGIYYLEIQSGGAIYREKIVKVE